MNLRRHKPVILTAAAFAALIAIAWGQEHQPGEFTPGAGVESRTASPFPAMDKDQDGQVTLSEFTVAVQSGRKQGLPPEEGGARGDHPGANSGKQAAAGMDRGRDASGPGVTRANSDTVEVSALFNQLDKDDTGWLSEAEVEAYQRSQEK